MNISSCCNINCSCGLQLDRTEVRKWTNNINDLMTSDMGKQLFIEYLKQREFSDALERMEFIRQCDGILKILESLPRSQTTFTTEFGDSRKKLVVQAIKVKLYPIEIQELKKILTNDSPEFLRLKVEGAKQTVVSRLVELHKCFSENIRQRYNCLQLKENE